MVIHTLTRRCCLMAAAFALTGCSSARLINKSEYPENAHWEGRMSVKVFGTPVQAFSANFVLLGSATQGQLLLSSAIGTTVAELEWSAHSARLRTAKESKQFGSLEELATAVTGADIPVTALFDWLRGENGTRGNWEADLQTLASGRLTAHTVNTTPAAELKLVLDL